MPFVCSCCNCPRVSPQLEVGKVWGGGGTSCVIWVLSPHSTSSTLLLGLSGVGLPPAPPERRVKGFLGKAVEWEGSVEEEAARSKPLHIGVRGGDW